MKKHLLFALALLTLPVTALAAFNDVQLTNGEVTLRLTIGGSVMSFDVAGSNLMQSLQVQGDTIAVNLQSGSSLTITSDAATTFTYSVGGASAAFTCSSSNSKLVITASDSQDVTVTPTGTTCTVPGSSAAATAGGDGTPNPSPTPAPTPEPSSAPAPASSGSSAPAPAPVQAPAPVETPAASVASPSPVAQLVSPVFNKDLSVGSRGDDVKRLQQLLAADKEIYPEGQVTGYLGNLTKAAIRKFQLKYGVIQKATDPGNGNLGPKTRAKMKEVYGSGVAPAAPAAVPVPAASVPAASDNSAKLQQLNQLMQMLQQLQALQAALKAQQGQ